jgi:hypothetical protein
MYVNLDLVRSLDADRARGDFTRSNCADSDIEMPTVAVNRQDWDAVLPAARPWRLRRPTGCGNVPAFGGGREA